MCMTSCYLFHKWHVNRSVTFSITIVRLLFFLRNVQWMLMYWAYSCRRYWSSIGLGLWSWCLTLLQGNCGGQLYCEENRSTRRKPPTCCKSLINVIKKCYIEYTSPEWESNYRTITTASEIICILGYGNMTKFVIH